REQLADSPPADSAKVRNAVIGMQGARDVAQVSAADMQVVRSPDAMPGEAQVAEEEEGESAERWTGYALVVSEVNDMETAREVRDNLAVQVGQFGKPEIWTGTWRRATGVVVAIGRLESEEAARDLANRMGAALPQGAWILHIIESSN
ncbi:MAG: hypothetical protein ACI9W4_002872, partial [Rhodothermales bacterium]